MTQFLQNIVDNPILLRELRRRMRGKALIYSIITYISLMTIITAFVLVIYGPSPFATVNKEMLQNLQTTGLQLFRFITGIQVLLVLIIAPTITAGLTTGEKERKTFDFLRVTTITRWMYITGCFLSTAFYVGLALLCALPLISLTFLYGGVNLNDVLRMFFLLLGSSFVLSSFGLYISSVSERTRTAQGIVVFLIFAMIFGGFFLSSIYVRTFAAAAATSSVTSTSLTPGVVYIFQVGVPIWTILVGALVAISWVFLLLAARKLFEPEETRAFSHSQFAIIFLLVIGGFLGVLSSNTFTRETPEVAFVTVGFLMLLVAVQSFGIGRMEVGDEIWQLKRLVPALRPIDQTLPFLLALAAIWYIVLSAYPHIVKSPVMPIGFINSVRASTVSSFLFFVFFARAMTTLTGSRRKAGLYSMILILGVLVFLPVVLAAFDIIFSGGPLWSELYAFSPIAMIADGFRNPKYYDSTVFIPIGMFASAFYALLAIGFAVYGESRRYARWKNFDYHYDMPAG